MFKLLRIVGLISLATVVWYNCFRDAPPVPPSPAVAAVCEKAGYAPNGPQCSAVAGAVDKGCGFLSDSTGELAADIRDGITSFLADRLDEDTADTSEEVADDVYTLILDNPEVCHPTTTTTADTPTTSE